MAAKILKPPNTPEWVFRWRRDKSPVVPKLVATVGVAVAFVLLVTNVRIQVRVPEKSAPRKASVIYLGTDAVSRDLRSRAKDGGPFPTRFEPRQWQGLAAVERAAMNSASFQVPAYVPSIADLPAENLVQPVELAAKGQRFFPPHPLPPPSAGTRSLVLTPVLYPLGGVTAKTLPQQLPPFAPAVDGAMSSATWRFLIRLNPDGSVADCVSLEKGNEPTADALESWLRKIQFAPPAANRPPWIALGIGFTNQPAHGTEPR